MIVELKQIQKNFLKDNKKVKIKQNTLWNDYQDDGLNGDKLKSSRWNYPFGKLARVIMQLHTHKNSNKIIFSRILPAMLLFSMIYVKFSKQLLPIFIYLDTHTYYTNIFFGNPSLYYQIIKKWENSRIQTF